MPTDIDPVAFNDFITCIEVLDIGCWDFFVYPPKHIKETLFMFREIDVWLKKINTNVRKQLQTELILNLLHQH